MVDTISRKKINNLYISLPNTIRTEEQIQTIYSSTLRSLRSASLQLPNFGPQNLQTSKVPSHPHILLVIPSNLKLQKAIINIEKLTTHLLLS